MRRKEDSYEEAAYSIQERIELDSFPSVKAFAKRGIGTAVLPERLAHKAVRSKELYPRVLKGFSPKGFGAHGIYATIHSSKKDDARIKFLVKSLRNYFSASRA